MGLKFISHHHASHLSSTGDEAVVYMWTKLGHDCEGREGGGKVEWK